MFGSDNSPLRVPPKREDIPMTESGEKLEETKPKKPPANVRREFKDVLDENETLSELEFDKASKKLTEKSAKGGKFKEEGAMSLFDLSRQTLKDAKNDLSGEAKDEEFVVEETSSLDTPEQKVNKFDEYSQPQTDLTFVNPHGNQAQSIDAAVSKIEAPRMVSSPSPIQDIVEKLIDKLMVIETNGKTDTTLTLNSGTFKGAVVVISQFDSAKGQLNIAFENLTQQAQALLDAQPNRDALLLALSEKGYTVQQMTTTTILEHKPIDIPQSEARFNKPREERQGQQQQKDEK